MLNEEELSPPSPSFIFSLINMALFTGALVPSSCITVSGGDTTLKQTTQLQTRMLEY